MPKPLCLPLPTYLEGVQNAALDRASQQVGQQEMARLMLHYPFLESRYYRSRNGAQDGSSDEDSVERNQACAFHARRTTHNERGTMRDARVAGGSA